MVSGKSFYETNGEVDICGTSQTLARTLGGGLRVSTAVPLYSPEYIREPLLLDIDTSPPSREEVEQAILSLKKGKARGLDLITSEMLRTDTTTAVEILIPLLRKIWITEDIPGSWNKLVPKRDELSQCSN